MMKNKFYQIVNRFISDNTLETYHPIHRLYQGTHSYVMLMLPIEAASGLTFRPDATYQLNEQHMTVFESLEQQGDSSVFHYTAKLNSPDGFYAYRLRVFFNDNDQPMGVSWYRKAFEEPDNLYVPIELANREIKLIMDFAAEQIKFLVSFVRDQQTTQINNAKERYEALYRAYEQLINDQVESVPFAMDQALTYLADMKKCLYLQDELGLHSSRRKFAYITRLEALTQITHQPLTEKEDIEFPSSSAADSTLDESLATNPGQAITVLEVSKSRIQTAELENTFLGLSLKHSTIPDAFKTSPTTTKKVLNEAYLLFIESLQNDYRACCEQYLLTMESHSSIRKLKQFEELNLRMDLIAKQQERIEAKYVQTLLLFGDQTTDILARLRACPSAIESLMITSIKLLIQHNKSNFLQLILDYKKFTTVELVDIIKVILSTDSAADCLSEVLKKYRIHSFLLQKDSTNVLLATYLFRLPIAHPMRLASVYDIPALSSCTFYQKLHIELQKSKNAALYDATTIARDIENVHMAESLYASSSEQKHQIRQNIEWIRQLPVSFQAALGRMSFEPGSSCEKKVTLIYQISREINASIALLSESNPAFVRRLKQESNSQMRQFKTEIYENEANFIEYLSSIDATRLDQNLDEMIEYCHLINNYLQYCLPTSMDILPEAKRTELREHYFGELKRFGMKQNPYESLQRATYAMVDVMRKVGTLFEQHAKQLQRIKNHPEDVKLGDIKELLSSFEEISRVAKAAKPLLDAEKKSNPNAQLK